MQNLELYGYGESVASNIARVALAEKKISYKYNLVYLESKGHHLAKEYKKLNPKNLVPTLVDNGVPIPDSIKIMRHIDSIYPQQGEILFPNTVDIETFENLLDFVSLDENKELGETLGTTAGGISAQILVKMLCKRPIISVIWDYLTKHSIKKRVPIFILLRILGKPPKSLSEKMAVMLAKHLLTIEEVLSHQKKFMMGDDYTAIDCCMTSILHRVQEMRFGSVLTSDKLPNLKNYWETLSSRNSYQEGILDYVTGEWAPEITALYGDGPSEYNDLVWFEIKNLLAKGENI
ncbi:glutathione S-transferase N-terminal domain-containing protein [Gammaproteobacteria bacterium]|nr:glutathione S-transferase N-terminal domain-containing protein [Gammaproteobacteria bacterium]